MTFGRYELGPQIGMGGMGEVFVGVQQGLGGFQKLLVLKLLLPHLAEQPDSVRMFLAEAQLAAQANHPNVVQIFDVGVESGRYYIAMEWVRGASMSSLIKALARADGKQVPARLVQYVGRALCDGLFYAHQLRGADGHPLGLIHRDVTPHNVLLSQGGEVKLTDFGIAKSLKNDGRTQPGTVWGKLEYMSPEQLRGGALDPRVDVFGAGVTLFHLATLDSPFKRASPAATAQAIASGELPSLAELRPDLPAPVSAAISRACAADPARRFADAREFRDAIAPVETEACAAELGELTRTLCGERTLELEEQTRQVFGAELGTAALPEGTTTVPATVAPASASLSAPVSHVGPRAPFLRWAVPALALVVLLSVFLGQRAFQRTEVPAPAPIVASPPSVPAPAPPAPVPAEAAEVVPHPAPVRPRRTGYLSIDAIPWARVSIDGRSVGMTPLDAIPHAEGPARVTLVCPDTHRTKEERVTVSAEKPVRIKADLR